VGTPTTNSYADTGLTASTQYTYTVKAIDAAGNLSSASNSSTVTTQAPADTTPPSITITAPTANLAANTTQTTLSATTNEAATCRYSTNASFTFSSGTIFSTTGGTSHSTTISGLQNSTSYTYYVKCQDTSGNTSGNASVTFSVATPPDTQAPTTPTGLTATAISSSQINLSWSASTDNVGVTGYNIYRNGTKIGTATTNSYSDSGLSASTQYSYTVSAYDAAGNTSAQSSSASATTQSGGTSGTCPKGTSYADGCSSAPAGTPQYSHLLDLNSPSTETFGQTYVTRAPWNVAGVDYAVGIQPGTVLKDPATLSMSGVSVNASTHIVTVNGSNLTLSGYDFSLEGGWEVIVNGNNDTIMDNNWKVGTNNLDPLYIPQGVSNTTVKYNVIDGAGLLNTSIGQGLIGSDGPGTVIEYNWIKNAYSENIVVGADTTTGWTLTVQYNLIENAGWGFNNGAHGDWVQAGIASGDLMNSIAFNYNTWLQDAQIAQARTQGITYAPEGQVQNASYNNNTAVVTIGAYVNYFVGYDLTWQITNSLQNNYVAGLGQSNGGGGGFSLNWHGTGPYSGTMTFAGNIDMANGKTINQDNSETATVGGNTCPKGTSYADGCSSAPSGTPQYSSLLSSYSTKPSWNVAGVDYAVGITPGTVLQDPLPNGTLASALVALGGSYDSVNHIINFSGSSANNAVISGWDFSLHNGIGIHVGTANNVTIRDNNFVVGTNQQTPIDLQGGTATNIIVEYNNINGNGLLNRSVGQGLIETNSPSLTVQYNTILNAFSEDLVIGSITAAFNTTVQYNVIGNSGMGQSQGAHGDWVQIVSAPNDNVTSATFRFNTFLQNLPAATAQTQGISFNGNVHGNFLGEAVSNNVMVAAPNTNVINTFVNSDMSWLNGTLTVGSNYIDPTGLQTLANWLTPVGGTGPYTGTVTCSTNINMLTGAQLTNSSCSTGSSDTTPPSTPTNLSASVVSSSQINLSWTASTDNVGVTGYNIYRGGTKIGTSATNSYSDSGLSASTQYSYTVSAYDAAGNTSAQSTSASATTQSGGTSSACPKGTSYPDGCSGAPSGTPQYPSLLSSYVTRAPWNVAGVDYPVGIQSGTVLKDPATLSMSGVSVNSSTHIITVSASNITLNGYDFSLEGGWEVIVNGSNDTISNNNWKVGTNNLDPLYIGQSGSNTTVKYNVIDGAGLLNTSVGQGLIGTNGPNTVIQYNWIKNAYSENIVVGDDTTTGFNFTVQYNLIENAGLGFNNGAHGDWVQNVNASGDIWNSMVFSYNTWTETVPIAQGRTQGITFPSTGQVQSETVSNNTFVVPSTSYVNYETLIDTSYLNGTATVQNNYADISGTTNASNGGGSFTFISNNISGTSGPYLGTVNCTSNVNMVTGSQLTGTGCSSGSSDTTPPSTPTNLTATAVSSSQINLTWSASTDNVGVTGYNIYRGGTKIGTSATNSYSDTTLAASTNYSYTVAAYDAAGNTSAQSSSASATTQAVTDTTPPTVTITAPAGQLAANTTQTTLSVTTNESATCAWSNTAGSAFASMTAFSTTGGTSHTTTLSGLTNGSSYTTYVKCKDTAGNISTDSSTAYSVASGSQGNGTPKVIFLTSGTTWTVPSDWNSSNNSIETIGGGAGGAQGTSASGGHGGAGGGGGAYSEISNLALTPGASITISIGSGGSAGVASGANPTAGGDTYFNGTSCTGASVCAKGGSAPTGNGVYIGGVGGAASSGVGGTKYSGGAGGSALSNKPEGGGGGGAAGPNGNGGAGGSTITFNGCGGGDGGGGNGGGSAGSSNPTTGNCAGGAGGNNVSGTGGGAGGANAAQGSSGTNGGGGGGGGGKAAGGTGGAGIEWDATHGSGGGGGGAGSDACGCSVGSGGNAGNYGGGGGGGTNDAAASNGGNGAQGIIVIKYTSS